MERVATPIKIQALVRGALTRRRMRGVQELFLSLCEDEREFERRVMAPTCDRAFLCGCSPYMFLEDTVSMYIHPLTPEGYKLERSEQLQDQWAAMPQRDKDMFGFEREAQPQRIVAREQTEELVAHANVGGEVDARPHADDAVVHLLLDLLERRAQ